MDDRPPEMPPGGAEQRRRFVLMLLLRAAVISALLGSTLYFNIKSPQPGLTLTRLLLYGLGAAVLLLTAGYGLWLRFTRKPLDLHVQIQVVFDVLAASLLTYITGGLESPFTFFYALPIVQTAVFFPRRGAMLTAGLSCLLLGALYVLESQGLLPVDLEGRVRLPTTASKVVYLLVLNYAVFLAIAWLAGSLGEQLRRTGRELKASEREVEALVALNRDIVLSLRSGLLALDGERRVSLINPVGEAILDCPADRALGRPVTDAFPELADLPGWAADSAGEAPGGSGRRYELEHARRDGNTVPVGLTLSPLSRADGRRVGSLVHMQDLTSYKAMEEGQKRAERLATLGGMAAVLAHEIRNPLASISGAVQVLGGGPDDGRAEADRRLRDIIVREAGRLDRLLSDFLAYARPREPRREWIDLGELVGQTLEAFSRGEEDGDGPRLESELVPLRARVDADQIRQVLFNLLANAEQAMTDGGRIRVELGREDDSPDGPVAVLSVSDDGPGVPPEVRARIFEPFVTTKEKGTGLGLAIVQQIVEAHGGSIAHESPEQGGCRFVVRLPEVL